MSFRWERGREGGSQTERSVLSGRQQRGSWVRQGCRRGRIHSAAAGDGKGAAQPVAETSHLFPCFQHSPIRTASQGGEVALFGP